MSGILGVFTAGAPLADPVLRRMCDGLASRGPDQDATWTGAGAALAVSRYDWEMRQGAGGPGLVVEDDGCVVVADATLYYTAELRDRLRAAGVAVRGETPGHLIAAAYRAWGEECTRWLEGDFAFVLWDRRERKAFCSRDFGGKRILYYADLDGHLIVASTLSAILAHPACPDDLNFPVIAAMVGTLLSAGGSETCYRAIRVVPVATDLVWRPGAGMRTRAHWEPAPEPGAERLTFGRAAEELRARLALAVRERLDVHRPRTTIWMSGGWDSTAVFGAGQAVLRAERDGRELLPVSMSYPEGDPGREDETIEQVAEFWKVPVRWVESEAIPLLVRPEETAGLRDEPLAHMYEHWNRALAAGSRALGGRVVLDGYGGDQLFQISDVFLADLLTGGHWRELAQEWSVRRARGRRYLLRSTLQPLVPLWLRKALAIVGQADRLRSHLERAIPAWIDRGFTRRHALEDREIACLPPMRFRDRTGDEVRWYLTNPLPVHISSILAGIGAEEGVELRSPLYDRRIIEFALARPRWERASGRETKYLLREAVRGLLPDPVLAPRPHRTGLTIGYSTRAMRRSYPSAFRDLLEEPLVLAELGIIEPGAFRRAVEAYLERGDESVRVDLFATLQTEWWLRSRLRAKSQGRARGRASAAAIGAA